MCFAAGCSGDAPGLLRACFFTDEEDGSEEAVSDSDVVMTGVHPASDPTEPGPSYLGCEDEMLAPTRFELVDEDGHRAWLGIDLHREDPAARAPPSAFGSPATAKRSWPMESPAR